MTSQVSLISEKELERELAQDIRERYIDQKFLYTAHEGAKKYYHTADTKIKKELQEAEDVLRYYRQYPKDYVKKDELHAFVSLGCGNAANEKAFLQKLNEEGYNILYIGVDISKGMLDMAEKELQDIKMQKLFIEADMLSNDFKESIHEVTKDCSCRIFALLGGTICNVNQTDIADSMYNLLLPEDLLWIEVRVREDNTMESELKFFNRYAQYLSGDRADFYFGPLKQIGVPFESGKLNMKSANERTVGALNFRFYFQFNQKVIIDLNGERIHFLPGEAVKLQTIRVYHPETFIDFFVEHEFEVVDTEVEETRGRFLFKHQEQKNERMKDW